MKHISVVVLLICHVLVVRAQSPEDARWSENFGANGILYESSGSGDSPVSSLLIDGADIYVGGKFTIAGKGILKWDVNTGRWKQLGLGVNGTVTQLCRWNDYIVVSGEFTEAGGVSAKNIALWNTKSEQWETVGKGGITGQINSMAVYRGELYVGGSFSGIDGKSVNGIARWNGTEWNTLGKGVYYGSVQALCVYNNELWVGGSFEAADGDKSKAKLAIWDGGTWKVVSGFSLPSIWNSNIKCLAALGNRLFVTGNWYWNGITLNNGALKKNVPQLVAFDGSTWYEPVTSFGSFTSQYAPLITSYGNDLIVAFSGLEEVNGISAKGIAKWNSQTDRWSAFGSGLSSGTQFSYAISAIATDGRIVVAGGSFAEAGGEFVNNVALFTLLEQRWIPFSSRSTNGLVGSIAIGGASGNAPRIYEIDGKMIVCGPFLYAGEKKVNSLAEWDGNTWQPIGTGIPGGVVGRALTSLSRLGGYIKVIAKYDDGLLIAGDYETIGGVTASGIAHFKNSVVNEFAGGISGAYNSQGGSSSILSVNCILVDGQDVYIGGTFLNAGGRLVNNIARWDGKQWNDMSGGLTFSSQSSAASVSVIKKMWDGRIIVGGYFDRAGADKAASLAIWDGKSWDVLIKPDSTDELPFVQDIEFEKETIFVGGGFKTIGGKYKRNIAYWDGNQWNEMLGGIGNSLTNGSVNVLKRVNKKLYVGGFFDVAGQTQAKNIAVWDIENKTWDALGSGLRNSNNAGFVNAIVEQNDTLFFSGLFDRAGTKQTINVAAWLPQMTTGIHESSTFSNEGEISIYPNPARSSVHIVFEKPESTSAELSVYDMLNRRIMSRTVTSVNGDRGYNVSIDINDFVNGMYTLRIEHDNQVKTAIFIVQH